MQPETYIHRIREPLLVILQELASQRQLMPDEEISGTTDVREMLKKCSAKLIERKRQSRSTSDLKQKHDLNRCIDACNFMTHAFNLNAHSHSGDLRSLVLALVSGIGMLKYDSNLTGDRLNDAWKQSAEMAESLLQAIGTKPSQASPDGSGKVDSKGQKQKAKDKSKTPANGIAAANGSSDLRPELAAYPKRRRLEAIRSEIQQFAEQRGRQMQPYQHLLQIRHLDQLIRDSPQTTDELRNWAGRLPSYRNNKPWLDRQVDLWGKQILKAIAAD